MPKDMKTRDEHVWEQYYATFDPASEPGSDAVVSSLSEATETDLDEMEPIESVVDPIIFDALVRRRRRPIQLSFVYHGHHVTVDTGGEIWIRNSETAGQSEFECSFGADESPSHGVVRAIAAVQGVKPTGVDPLCDSIDPDALDAVFDDTTGTSERDIRVSFRINDLEIEVSGDRHIMICPTAAVA